MKRYFDINTHNKNIEYEFLFFTLFVQILLYGTHISALLFMHNRKIW